MDSAKILEVFAENKPVKMLKRGTVLSKPGSNPECVWYLKKGFVRQYSETSGRGVVNLHIYKPGSVFPLMWLLTEEGARYGFSALTDVELAEIKTGDFLKFLDRHPELVTYFAKRILLGVNGLLTRLESLVVDDVDKRLERLFDYLASSFGEKENSVVRILLPLTHQDIASWIGAARETTTASIRRLIKRRLISKSGKYYRKIL